MANLTLLRLRAPALLGWPLFLLAACGGSDVPEAPDAGLDPDAGTIAGDAGTVGVDAGPGDDSLFAVTTQVISGSDTSGYLVLTPSVTATQTLELSTALELPGRAIAVGPAEGEAVFVSSDEAPTLTRYDLRGTSLVRGQTLSFAIRGVSSISEYQSQIYFVRSDKAYYFDPLTGQAIIWNPETMTISGGVDISGVQRADSLPFFSQTPPKRIGDELFYPLGWLTSDRAGTREASAMVVLNVETDEATVVVDERCAWARDGVSAPDGFIYLASETYDAAARFVDPTRAGPPCMIRFDPVSRTFDPSFFVPLDDIVNPERFGDYAGMLLPSGEPGRAYLRVMDTSLAGDVVVPIVVAVSPFWTWWQVELSDSPTASPLANPPPLSSGRNLVLDVGDMLLTPEVGGEPVTTSLRVITGGRLGDANTQIRGRVFSVAKVR